MPFQINFNKNDVIDSGFRKAFKELLSRIVSSSDQKKIDQTKLNIIKGMVESFSIREEKFINEIYSVNLGVSFNKRKFFNFLENENVFPSMPIKKKILFIPIIIEETKKDLLIFSSNKIYNQWNNFNKSYHLIEYILPTEDLEDLRILRNKYEFIEEYDFKEIISKYSLEDSIVALIFKNDQGIRVLSRISINKNIILKNKLFSDKDLRNDYHIEDIIEKLKLVYEDNWKNYNLVNTSIKLPISIKISSSNNPKILNFEKILKEKHLVYDFTITKFDKDFVYYQIIFNGTPNNFLKSMNIHNYNFNTQNKIWVLK